MQRIKQGLQSAEKVDVRVSELEPIRGWAGGFRKRCGPYFDMHYPVELGIVMSGRMRRFYRTGRFELAPGQVWFCGAWEPHGWEVTRAPCNVTVLDVWPPALTTGPISETPAFNWMAPFSVPPGKRPQVAPKQRARLLRLGRRIRAGLAMTTPYRQYWLKLYFLEVMLTLIETWSAPVRLEPMPADAVMRINRAVKMALESTRFIGTHEAARACGMSRNTFSRLFQNAIGTRFADFALRYRLQAATAQMLRTGEPLKAIALRWGFTDASHFHHCFQFHYNCSPDDYRQQRQSSAMPIVIKDAR